jgi:hypothetical protein
VLSKNLPLILSTQHFLLSTVISADGQQPFPVKK